MTLEEIIVLGFVSLSSLCFFAAVSLLAFLPLILWLENKTEGEQND